MKKICLLSALLVPTIGIVSTAAAQVVPTVLYSSGSGVNQFNTNNGYYDRGDSLNDTPVGAPSANQWQTTDPYDPINNTGGTSQIQFIPGYTGGEGPSGSDAGNNSIYWGGYDPTVVPGTDNPSLYYSFNQPYSTTSELTSTTFTSDFALFPSTGGPNDTFGFSFWTLGRTSLLAQVQFTNINATDFGVSLNGSSVAVLTYGSLYSLQGLFDNSDVFNLSIAGVTADADGSGVVTNYTRGSYVPLGSVALAAGSTDLFETASIDWDLASDNPEIIGENYMIITSAQIESAVTPEPATVLAGVFLAGVTAYTTIRRRRQAKTAAVA